MVVHPGVQLVGVHGDFTYGEILPNLEAGAKADGRGGTLHAMRQLSVRWEAGLLRFLDRCQ